MNERHETRESGMDEGCCWYSRMRANWFGLVHIFTKEGLVVFLGDAGLTSLAAGESSRPGPSGRSTGAVSLIFQVGRCRRLLGSGSKVSVTLAYSGMTS